MAEEIEIIENDPLELRLPPSSLSSIPIHKFRASISISLSRYARGLSSVAAAVGRLSTVNEYSRSSFAISETPL